MRFKIFNLLFVFSAILILASCLDTTTVTTTSSDASFVSLTLAGNDSVKTAKFTLDGDGVTIINVDSLPYGTRIDSVYPTFSFKSSSKAVLHFPKNRIIYKYKFSKGSDSIYISGKDTVDFRQALWTNKDSALWINNYASDGTKHNPPYKIKINVHKVQPELYVWSKIADKISDEIAVSQKAIMRNDTIFYYLNDGSTAYLYTSTNGNTWKNVAGLTGLPQALDINDMILFKGKFFVTKDRLNIYSSSDAVNWTRTTVSSFHFKSLLCELNGKLWAVVQSLNDATYHFATSLDGEYWNTIGTIPDNFPVNDFSASTITTLSKKSKVLIFGGYSVFGGLLTNCWSSEDGIIWVDFSTENHSLDSLAAGASVISYDKKLLLFGKYNLMDKLFYRESKDEGFSWQVPSLTYNQIRQAFPGKSPITNNDTIIYNYYKAHAYQSAVVNTKNQIFLIGGKSSNPGTSEIWTGKLNRKKFAGQ